MIKRNVWVDQSASGQRPTPIDHHATLSADHNNAILHPTQRRQHVKKYAENVGDSVSCRKIQGKNSNQYMDQKFWEENISTQNCIKSISAKFF